jgi:predicted O-methyltransferase YrrM
MKKFAKTLLPIVDVGLSILAYPAAVVMGAIRRVGTHRLPISKRVLLQVGVFPIRNHYYEPLFDARVLRYPPDRPRHLPGIDWNVNEQLDLLRKFDFNEELAGISTSRSGELDFHFNNDSFESGDAEYLYSLIRERKPRRIFEIGSGYSTLMAIRATKRNKQRDAGYQCRHLCIEPYEMPWLEKTGVEVMRRKVEDVDAALFAELGEGDLLFIDSSHVIRPQGDVLFEYLELLPVLRPGVIVHVHDIFSPRDYLRQWMFDEVKFWNEQYLLEAFLSCNSQWKIIGALNYLKHDHFELLREKCPYLTRDREPGSFYIQRTA